MATRDLTRKYIEFRQKGGKRRSSDPNNAEVYSDGGLLEDAGAQTTWASQRQTLPPVWVDKVDVVDEDIKKIQLKMRELAVLHTKRLMVTFDESEREKEREIEVQTQEITKLFKHAEAQLKGLGGKAGGATDAERKVKNNMQRAAATKLQNLSSQFRASQKEYLRRLSAQKAGGDDFDFLSEEEKKLAAAVRSGAMESGAFNRQQLAVLEDTEAQVAQRDQEITNIVKSIEELSAIFKELAVLVIDQGTILDRIDFNMEQVIEHTEEGVRQLQKAEEHQKSALPKKCIALLLFLIAVMMVLLVLKHTNFKK